MDLLKKYWWILLLIMLAPVAINFFLLAKLNAPFVGNNTDWLEFWGSYAGSLITGMITLYVLNKTNDNHMELINFRKNELIVDQKERDFEYLRDRFQSIISFTTEWVTYLYDFDKINQNLQAIFLKKDEIFAFKELYFSKGPLTKEESEYSKLLDSFLDKLSKNFKLMAIMSEYISALQNPNSGQLSVTLRNDLILTDQEKTYIFYSSEPLEIKLIRLQETYIKKIDTNSVQLVNEIQGIKDASVSLLKEKRNEINKYFSS